MAAFLFLTAYAALIKGLVVLVQGAVARPRLTARPCLARRLLDPPWLPDR